MAAATDEEDQSITKAIELFDNEITLNFHAGLEFGEISIIIKK